MRRKQGRQDLRSPRSRSLAAEPNYQLVPIACYGRGGGEGRGLGVGVSLVGVEVGVTVAVAVALGVGLGLEAPGSG